MQSELHDALRQIIVDDLFVEIAPEQIGLDDGLRTVVGLDSVGFVELRVLCERRFGVQINDDDYNPENFSSVRRVVNLIERLKRPTAGQPWRRVMVYVTGMAWTTPLGDSLDDVWSEMLRGKSGIRSVPSEGRLRNQLAAPVAGPAAADAPDRRLQKIARGAIGRALKSAGRDLASSDSCLVLGTSFGTYLENSPDESLYSWADQLGRDLGCANLPITVSTACSSGSDAILLGAELLRAGQYRCCVCGGADVLTWTKRIGHSTLGTMSPTFLRAFDQRHDGTVLGEGAGFVVLENESGDREPLAIFRGSGSANDATGMTAADTTGRSAQFALERSLSDAGLCASDIGLINAHGSGTQMNDLTEKNALRNVFTSRPAPLVFATKGNFGHSLGATGALEAIALILSLRSGKAPPIVGLEQPDPEFPLPLAYGKSVNHSARLGLSLTLGFGGFDTSLIFEVTP